MKFNYKKIDVTKKYNLPSEVKFCKKCVMSNQRPRIVFDSEGVCNACRYHEYKATINWDEKADELCNNILCTIGWSIVCILLIWCISLIIMMIYKL